MGETEPEAIFDCRPNLLVDDLGVSLEFYRSALGFRLGWHWSDRRARFLNAEDQAGDHAEPGEPGTALVGRDRAQIILTQSAGAHTTRLHFDVHTAEQVDALFREWTDRGTTIDEPPSTRPWGTYEMRLRDPDGNVLRISAPPPA
jgi:catechol 2,3-dioxygenase-like lactoylglutathione lyase family enzyme